MLFREANFADAPGIARVHVDSWRATYRGIIPDDILANLSYETRQVEWESGLGRPNGERVIFVAEDADEGIVGFACGGPERSGDSNYTGELYAVYVLERYQRMGVGKALTRLVGERLVRNGLTGMLVWVLAENPSRGFYERLGGQIVRGQIIEVEHVSLEEVAYGWLDLQSQPWLTR